MHRFELIFLKPGYKNLRLTNAKKRRQDIYTSIQNIFSCYSLIKRILYFLVFLIFTFIQAANSAAYSEAGQPFFTHFSSKAYDGLPENWKIVQDKRGVMYFGNESGILEYDGNSWQKIKVPNLTSVRSMSVAGDGTIYVCAFGDFGYLRPDSTGQITYHSLKPFLDKKYHNSGEMWDVITLSGDAFFKTKDKIFKWNGRQITVLDSAFAYRLYKIDDKIYSRSQNDGLLVIDGDSLKLMPDGAFFAEIGVYNMLPYIPEQVGLKGHILVTTNSEGLFLHDGRKFHPFKTEVDSFLMANQVYNACRMLNGNYALATQRGGVVIIDSKGRLIRFINEDSGLLTNVIYDIYADRQGGLWLATNNGIIYCETPSPLSIFQNSGALKDKSNAVLRFKNTIYAANDLGVLYLSKKNSAFQLVEGSNKPAYELFGYEDVLLAGTNWGLAAVKNKKLQPFLLETQTGSLIASKIYPGRIYAGTHDGLTVILKQKNNQLRAVYTFKTNDEVLSVIEEKDGGLWLTGHFLGIYHISGNIKELSYGTDNGVSFTSYNKQNILPGNEWKLFEIQGKMLLGTDTGIFTFDRKTQRFIPDSTLGANLAGPPNIVSLIEKSTNGDLWILSRQNGTNELGKAFLQNDGRYLWKPYPVFRRAALKNTDALYADISPNSNKEILWISTDEGLVRYNPEIVKNFQFDFLTLIRKVIVHNDSIIFNGLSTKQYRMKSIVLPFSKNDVRFEFSAVSFDKPEASLYQYFLEGNDTEWSNWSTASTKGYTNLSGGDYTFRVRSKNVYGTTGAEDVFRFTVLPPWFLTWQAYILYTFFIFSGIFLVDRYMRAKIIEREREKAKLREAELVSKQAQELETVDRLVRVINKADDLETLFKSLLEKTISFIPQAEKAALFLLDHKDNSFKIAYTFGYKIDDLEKITFLPEELKSRYADNSDEIEKGIYIVSDTKKLEGDEKLTSFKKAKAMLVMAVEWENRLEAYVVFDSFATKNAFNPSTARILNRFREHAVSAISKARSLKILQEKNEKIVKTQEQLIIQEKLASLGQLTAGIAHEIKNPLNFVKNFAELSVELMQELREELSTYKEKMTDSDWEEIESILKTLEENSLRINEHSRRADSIVRSMLQHSRGKSGERRETDINAMLEENINLAYHGLRAQNSKFNITIKKDFDSTIGTPVVVPQDLSRVFLNILQNAFYASMRSQSQDYQKSTAKQPHLFDQTEKKASEFQQEPTLWVITKNMGDKLTIRIRDNGPGIPKKIRNKVFNPFFSTKPSGDGTGLGLSIAYDIIVKEHKGEISFITEENSFTEFIIRLPRGN